MSDTLTITQDAPLAHRLAFTQADRLDKALTAAGVSVQEMADYLGVSRYTLSRYIAGKGEPRLQTLRLWALRTGVPLHWLQTGHFQGDDTCRLTAGCSAKLSYRGRNTQDSTGHVTSISRAPLAA